MGDQQKPNLGLIFGGGFWPGVAAMSSRLQEKSGAIAAWAGEGYKLMVYVIEGRDLDQPTPPPEG